MRNKHPGVCYRCGKRVEVGEGHFQRSKGKWIIQHAQCAIDARKLDIPASDPSAPTDKAGT